MKIGIISTISGCEWAGTEEVWADVARTALNRGHEVHLAADTKISHSRHLHALKKMGLKSVARNPFRPMRVYLAKERVYSDTRAFVNFEPDTVLINSGSPIDVVQQPFLSMLCDKLTCPKVFFCHFNSDLLDIGSRSRVSGFLQGMSKILFVSSDNLSTLERQLACKLPNTQVILNRSRVTLESPPDIGILQSGGLRAANVARFDTRWKGQDILLETLSLPSIRDYGLQVDLFGSGRDEKYINDLIKHNNLENSVRILGYERELSNIWANRQLLLLPSRGEGTPLVVLEAMMHGRIVVATDVGGVREVLEDGMEGFISEGCSPSSFANAIERALQSRSIWSEISENAHRRALELSDSRPGNQVLEEIENLYLRNKNKTARI